MANSRKSNNTETKALPEKQTIEKKNIEKKKLERIDDYAILNVRSNVNGTLIYINHKTRERVVWRPEEDERVQQITFAELRDMRGSQIEFFANNWIVIDSIETEGYEDYTPQDVYAALRVSQYYDKETTPSDFNEVFKWSPEKIIEVVPKMSTATKENLLVSLNEAVRGGKLDSLRKIKAFETALNCSVAPIDVE